MKKSTVETLKQSILDYQHLESLSQECDYSTLKNDIKTSQTKHAIFSVLWSLYHKCTTNQFQLFCDDEREMSSALGTTFDMPSSYFYTNTLALFASLIKIIPNSEQHTWYMTDLYSQKASHAEQFTESDFLYATIEDWERADEYYKVAGTAFCSSPMKPLLSQEKKGKTAAIETPSDCPVKKANLIQVLMPLKNFFLQHSISNMLSDYLIRNANQSAIFAIIEKFKHYEIEKMANPRASQSLHTPSNTTIWQQESFYDFDIPKISQNEITIQISFYFRLRNLTQVSEEAVRNHCVCLQIQYELCAKEQHISLQAPRFLIHADQKHTMLQQKFQKNYEQYLNDGISNLLYPNRKPLRKTRSMPQLLRGAEQAFVAIKNRLSPTRPRRAGAQSGLASMHGVQGSSQKISPPAQIH